MSGLPVLLFFAAPAQPAYDTMDAAAVAAERQAFEISRRCETTGVIFRWHGEYHYTIPVGNGNAAEVGGVEKIYLPAGSVIVGDYHTHPETLTGDDLGQYFSDADLHTYESSGWRGYVGVGKLGVVLRWDGRTHIESWAGHLVRVGDGTIVGRLQ